MYILHSFGLFAAVTVFFQQIAFLIGVYQLFIILNLSCFSPNTNNNAFDLLKLCRNVVTTQIPCNVLRPAAGWRKPPIGSYTPHLNLIPALPDECWPICPGPRCNCSAPGLQMWLVRDYISACVCEMKLPSHNQSFVFTREQDKAWRGLCVIECRSRSLRLCSSMLWRNIIQQKELVILHHVPSWQACF